MIKILIILVIALAFEAFGVVALKKGIDEIVVKYHQRMPTTPLWKNVLKLVGNGLSNKNVLLGLALETIFFVGLLYLLGQRDVSLIWPLTALSFVMTALAAKFLLHETVSGLRWGGVVLIMLGVALISYSEHVKENKPLAAPPASPAVAPQP